MENIGLIKLYERSIIENWDLPALTDYIKEETFTYGEMAVEIQKLHLLFQSLGIRRGNHIAVCGRNNPRWCISFLATITYGAVVVPILQDFNSNDIQHILNHSDSKLLFVNEHLFEDIDPENFCPKLFASLSLDNFSPLFAKTKDILEKCRQKNIQSIFREQYPRGFSAEDVNYEEVDKNDVVVLNYTSGTTGFTKGVMLTAENILGNVMYGHEIVVHFKGSNALSFLPLAHVFGCAFDFLYPISVGTHITLLGKLPSPRIIIEAMTKVKPDVIFMVPMVIEKIYRKVIIPLIEKKSMQLALRFPLIESHINEIIRQRMIKQFGGKLYEVIIGGAALSGDVEAFLKKVKFPFMVGYGMTECAPLITYTDKKEFKPTSCGKVLHTMQVRIISKHPMTVPGEIQVKGPHVMKGYYKNEEATKAAFTPDGWLRTGDIGTMDEDGTLYIRGRLKTMILTSAGQNIYPEEIESKLNAMPHVAESLVIERNGKLVALVYPDYDPSVTGDGPEPDQKSINDIMVENLRELNRVVAPYEKVSEILLSPNEFIKTPKKSIKRYLYTGDYPQIMVK